ncbi:MAG: cytochrome c maturation protein CcmE [Nitrospirae bacterium]|nr:cytochrome c maturation protein CcmE [Nitrospirota bacterium]
MSPRWIALAIAAAAILFLVYRGTEQGLVYYYTPTEIHALTGTDIEKRIRVGGLVEGGSLQRTEGSLLLKFRISDGAQAVDVLFSGAPPDLFQEGRGAIAEGQWKPEGVFEADNILVKHSEEYQPVYDASSGSKPPYREP